MGKFWLERWSLESEQKLNSQILKLSGNEPGSRFNIFGSGLREKNRSESENMSPAALVGVNWITELAEPEVFGWGRILNNTGSRSWIFSPTPPMEVQLDRLLHHTK